MSKQFETVAKWLDKLNYVEADDKTNNKTGNSVIHDPLTDDYKQAAEYWQRMYEETFAERTCEMRADGAHCMNGVEFYECRSCGEYACIPTAMGKSEPPNYCPNCGAKVASE